MDPHGAGPVPLRTIVREWGRLGVVGFGGPPTHIALLRRLCVDERRWIDATEFEAAIAATNLLPGPASTQLAIWCAWRLRGRPGALLGGVCFIVPGLGLIVALSALFLASSPPRAVLAAAAGAGAAVPAVAANAAWVLLRPSWRRVAGDRGAAGRWLAYVAAAALVAVLAGAYVVIAIAVAGLVELAVHRRATHLRLLPLLPAASAAGGGLAALAWVAFKVGALSYGGGFVIIPLMQHDAVTTYGWMTGQQFLNAVALGQVTPGPVVLTAAAVGYAAAGVNGALLAALVAFGPSFAFVMVGGPHLDRLRHSDASRRFLTGAGAAAIGAIAGSAVTLARTLHEWWQVPVLVAAALWLLAARRGVVSTIALAGVVGIAVVLLGGAPLGR